MGAAAPDLGGSGPRGVQGQGVLGPGGLRAEGSRAGRSTELVVVVLTWQPEVAPEESGDFLGRSEPGRCAFWCTAPEQTAVWVQILCLEPRPGTSIPGLSRRAAIHRPPISRRRQNLSGEALWAQRWPCRVPCHNKHEWGLAVSPPWLPPCCPTRGAAGSPPTAPISHPRRLLVLRKPAGRSSPLRKPCVPVALFYEAVAIRGPYFHIHTSSVIPAHPRDPRSHPSGDFGKPPPG